MSTRAIIQEAYYSDTVGLVSPAFSIFASNWALTAKALHRGLAKHVVTPDDIKWDMPNNRPITEHAISCVLGVGGYVRFRLMDVQVYLYADKRPTVDVALVVEDAMKVSPCARSRVRDSQPSRCMN